MVWFGLLLIMFKQHNNNKHHNNTTPLTSILQNHVNHLAIDTSKSRCLYHNNTTNHKTQRTQRNFSLFFSCHCQLMTATTFFSPSFWSTIQHNSTLVCWVIKLLACKEDYHSNKVRVSLCWLFGCFVVKDDFIIALNCDFYPLPNLLFRGGVSV